MNRLEEKMNFLESAAEQTADKMALMEREVAQKMRRDFDQSLVDRDSNVAIHSLNNNYIIAQCRSLVATKAAKYGSRTVSGT
jgi:hypothetical protein